MYDGIEYADFSVNTKISLCFQYYLLITFYTIYILRQFNPKYAQALCLRLENLKSNETHTLFKNLCQNN